jgi:hypothetical protein
MQSDATAHLLEELQLDLGGGPCVEASCTGRPVLGINAANALARLRAYAFPTAAAGRRRLGRGRPPVAVHRRDVTCTRMRHVVARLSTGDRAEATLCGEDAVVGEPVRDREQVLIEAFVGLADTLVDDYDVIDLLDRLVGYCVELLAADAGGIMLADPRGILRVVASSNEQTEWIELMQLQADEGPCVESFRTAAPVSVPDLGDAAPRWPRFVAALADREAYRSVHAVPLRLRRDAIGALNLFHHEPGALPAADLALGQALADVATISILQERAIRQGEVLSEQLQTALTSRVIIEQAKGVVAERGNLTMDVAFERLRQYARRRNLRLSEISRQVVETGLATDVLAHAAGQGR